MEQKSSVAKLLHGLKPFGFSLALDTEHSEFLHVRSCSNVLVDEFHLRVSTVHQLDSCVNRLVDVVDGVELSLPQ